MNTQKAYINGFVKRAAQHGLNKNEAISLLKSAAPKKTPPPPPLTPTQMMGAGATQFGKGFVGAAGPMADYANKGAGMYSLSRLGHDLSEGDYGRAALDAAGAALPWANKLKLPPAGQIALQGVGGLINAGNLANDTGLKDWLFNKKDTGASQGEMSPSDMMRNFNRNDGTIGGVPIRAYPDGSITLNQSLGFPVPINGGTLNFANRTPAHPNHGKTPVLMPNPTKGGNPILNVY
jgi:hypothetical protein